MKEIFLNPKDIPQIFAKNIQDPNTIFVFSTDTVMNSWIDWIITHPDLSGTDAVPFERFLAWDNFKREYLSVSQNGLTAIPSLLKQLFVNDLIQKNADKPENERFQSIINPKEEYAQTADSFSDWICGNLPSLHFWKTRYELYKDEYGQMDKEDKDYDYLYSEYSKFLEKNNLFEPSWIENVEVINSDKKFIFIYPELLQDFQDYINTFENSDNVTLCLFPKDIPSPKSYIYPDSRSELRQTMLQIINLVNEKKCDWSEIALSIPDIETYRPYIEREFELYGIPYVIKSGIPLTKNSAGRIFREIYNCHNNNFTFESVRSLLLDECVPWKEEYNQLREDLIREGNNMRCICSPYEKDIWLQALTSKTNTLTKQKKTEEADYFNQLKEFYLKIRTNINQFFIENSNFENIRNAWMQFKTTFLQDNNFTEDANNILSRCIKELDEIIKIEKDFADCKLMIKSPFDFYLTLLDGKTYTPQTLKTGVQIFKYKLSAAANFKVQFVIDASQKNLELVYKRLTFLNSTKRAKLHLPEDDKLLNPTEVFIKLYAKKTECTDDNFVHFSSATDSFAGYTIPHSLLDSTDKNIPCLDEKDYILNEKKYILDSTQNSLQNILPQQKQAFENWASSAISTQKEYNTNEKIRALINNRFAENKKLNISARGDLENFFPCPRKWLLKSILNLKDDTLDTSLMQGYDIGNLNHKILELIFTAFVNKQLPYYDKEKKLFFDAQGNDYNNEMETLIKESIDKSIFYCDFSDSPLVTQTLKNQKGQIYKTIKIFLSKMLLKYSEKGFGMCTVCGMEVSKSLEKENFNYKGRIDCILETPSKQFIIIDFKNSDSSIPNVKDMYTNQNDLLGDFQMPIYKKLISDKDDDNIYSIFYLNISKASKSGVIDPDKSPQAGCFATLTEYHPTLDTIDVYSELFNEYVHNLHFIPHQSTDLKDKLNVKSYDNCVKCNFKSICRTTYTVASKQISKKGDAE